MVVVIVALVIFFIIFILVNGVSFVIFLNDKRKAENHSWRTPENTLLFCAFLGPFGAYAAMKVCHHKTSKTKFLLVPAFIILQLVLGIYLLFNHFF